MSIEQLKSRLNPKNGNHAATLGILSQMQIMKGEKGDKGDRGEDGYTPVKGKDYFTGTEVKQIADYIQSQVKNGVDGADGANGKNGETPVRLIDYWTKEDQEKMISDVLKKLPKTKEGKPLDMKNIVSEVLKEIKMPDTAALVSKGELTEFLRRGGFRGGGDTVEAGSGVSITSVNGVKRISAAGGSLSVLTTANTIDDSNLTFVFASEPTLVVINGQTWREGSVSGGVQIWSKVGSTVTLTNPVGVDGDIYALG